MSVLRNMLLIIASFSTTAFADSTENKQINVNIGSIFETVVDDYKQFYSTDVFYRAAGMYALGATLAHTSIDTEFQDWHQQNVHSSGSDNLASVVKVFGEKSILLPLTGLAASYQLMDTDSKVGQWGEKSFRAYLVGAPVLASMQLLTGGSRPRDHYQDAKWRPFNDDNGVSGHAFVGAVPFLTLANMPELNTTQRNLAYAGSALTAWSRINDDAHFLSQAILGWYMAWESVNAVSRSTKAGKWYSVKPQVVSGNLGLGINFTW